MKATAYLMLVKRRVKQNGKYPVKIRVIFQRKPKDFSIGIDLTEQEYLEANKEKPNKEVKEDGIKMKIAFGKANSIIQNIGLFSFGKFENEFYETSQSLVDGKLSSLFDKYIEIHEAKGSINTVFSYKNSLASLSSFRKNLTIYDITPKFLQEYERFMIDNGKSITTIGIYLRQLRAIYNNAVSLKLIDREYYPFGKGKYIIPVGQNIKKALATKELQSLFNYTPKIVEEQKALDFWVFSYLSNGMNFIDIAKLKWENLTKDFIHFVRSKTKNTKKGIQQQIRVPLHPRVSHIIKRWGNKSKEGYVFSVLSEDLTPLQVKYRVQGFIKFTNTHMEEIRKHLKISLPCNTYACRHSFATVLKRKNVSTEFISESLGHSSILTTTAYLASFEDKTKIEYSNLLTSF